MADKKYPQVLLLGNGINRAFGSDSWDELLEELRGTSEIRNGEEDLPYPLRAILVSHNQVGPRLMEIKENPRTRHLLYGTFGNEAHRQLLQDILKIGFNHILTTNYSYELESASLSGNIFADEGRLKKMQRFVPDEKVKKAESRYLLHTYNEVSCDGRTNRIWHIHGEARKCSSIILGHYYYASLLFKYKELLDRRGYRYVHENLAHFYDKSWLDAFILSDVYILGFGFDPSEFDLWWLLNRKKREHVDVGSVYYYAPGNEKNSEGKIGLLCDLGVQCLHLGFEYKDSIGDKQNFYREFYRTAIEDISHRAAAARQGGNTNGSL